MEPYQSKSRNYHHRCSHSELIDADDKEQRQSELVLFSTKHKTRTNYDLCSAGIGERNFGNIIVQGEDNQMAPGEYNQRFSAYKSASVIEKKTLRKSKPHYSLNNDIEINRLTNNENSFMANNPTMHTSLSEKREEIPTEQITKFRQTSTFDNVEDPITEIVESPNSCSHQRRSK